MAKVGLIVHPKTGHLAALLGVEKNTAVGILQCLFTYAGQVAPNGLIGKWPDAVIAVEGCFWSRKKPEILIKALCEAGWIVKAKDAAAKLGIECPGDHERWYINDWHEHCENWVRERLQQSGSDFFFGHSSRRPEGRPPKEPKLPAKTHEKPPENSAENSVKTEFHDELNNENYSENLPENEVFPSRAALPFPNLPLPIPTEEICKRETGARSGGESERRRKPPDPPPHSPNGTGLGTAKTFPAAVESDAETEARKALFRAQHQQIKSGAA